MLIWWVEKGILLASCSITEAVIATVRHATEHETMLLCTRPWPRQQRESIDFELEAVVRIGTQRLDTQEQVVLRLLF